MESWKKIEMIWLDKYGYPVEHIEVHWFVKWLRDRIHGKAQVVREAWEANERNRTKFDSQNATPRKETPND